MLSFVYFFTFGMTQSDHLKWPLLFFKHFKNAIVAFATVDALAVVVVVVVVAACYNYVSRFFFSACAERLRSCSSNLATTRYLIV
jgi:hypothetical protein